MCDFRALQPCGFPGREHTVRIAVPCETEAGEPRVAATPETVRKLKTLGAEVAVARGAGFV
jgi:alanine dehydrogenase